MNCFVPWSNLVEVFQISDLPVSKMYFDLIDTSIDVCSSLKWSCSLCFPRSYYCVIVGINVKKKHQLRRNQRFKYFNENGFFDTVKLKKIKAQEFWISHLGSSLQGKNEILVWILLIFPLLCLSIRLKTGITILKVKR